MLVRDLLTNATPCPYSFTGTNDRHLFYNQIKDRLYHHLSKDEDEIIEDKASELYYKLDEVYNNGYMRLYMAEHQALNSYKSILQTYWWQCPICDYVLPATTVGPR